MDLEKLDRIARRHHGVITLEMSGLHEQAWRRAIRSGSLRQIHPGVARLIGAPVTIEQRIAAGVLALRPEALASHRSAAILWGIVQLDEREVQSSDVDVTVIDRRGSRRLHGVRVHRPRDLEHLSPPARRHDIRCTNILRTLCDLGAVDPGGVIDAVGQALGSRLVTLGALEHALATHARPGRSGIAALRSAIDSWSIDSRPTDAQLEKAMRRLVDRYHLPPVEFHAVIEGWEVDFRVVGTPIILECDGWSSHGLDREQFERDRRRDSELIAAGWIVVRFTYRSITGAPAHTAARIRAVVDRWQILPSPPTP